MKKVLIDKNLNWYKANLHCHSVLSDGAMTPEQLKNAYKAEGYQILAITDHEILLDHSDLNDENFLTLTSTEYSITEKEPSFKPLNEDMEKNSWNRSKTIHINAFAKNPHDTFQPAASINSIWHGKQYLVSPDEVDKKFDGYERIYTKESINETIRRLNEKGFLVQYNHPYWSLNEREDYMALEGIWSLEILNYATELETASEYCPYIYDDMLRGGKKIFCSMGDDNHNHKNADGQFDMKQSFGGFTIIGADELKYDKIYDAMKNGNFYCSSGPRIYSLVIEDGKIKIDCSPATNVALVGYGRCNTNIKGDNLTHVEFDFKDMLGYFRITVMDGLGKRAHTNAYWMEDLK